MPPPPPEGTRWPGASQHQLSFRQLLAEAIADISSKGYISPEAIARWIGLLRNAAERELGPEADIDAAVRHGLGATFARLVDDGRVAKYVPGVARFNIGMIKPQLRAELDRRIIASADLIKLRRREAVEQTLARLSGWATSIPPGGAGVIDKREVRADIGKSVAQFKYERRRVEIDQGAKLVANVANIVAVDAGAIAGIWHSHGEHDRSYNARKDHLARAGKFYAVRGSWAIEQGLINKGAGYLDDMTAAGQEPFCRCFITYVMSPRRVPEEMLTAKGRAWIKFGQDRRAA